MNQSVEFLRFIEQTNKAATAEELFGYLERCLSHLGYDRVVYSFFSDHHFINQTSKHGFLRNYPEDWMRYYTEKDYEHIDPVITRIKQRPEPFFWAELDREKPLSPKENRVMVEGEEAKLLDGIGLRLYSPYGAIAGCGVASSSGGMEINRDRLCLVNAIMQQFHLAYLHLATTQYSRWGHVTLTKREKEVLSWVMAGKSNRDIGTILGISKHGVDHHLRNIFKKLGVASRGVAALRGIQMGLINPE